MMKQVLVVDDHALVREGLTRVIVDAFPGCSVQQASDGPSTMKSLWCNTLDLVLLDISLVGKGGLEVLKDIKDAYPKLPVLIVSMLPEDQAALRALRAGAAGYVSKASPSEVLVEAIRQAASGGKFITQKVAELLATEVTTDRTRPIHETLSNREYETMLRIGRGETVTEIAAALNLSDKTVSTYRTRILAKMGVRNNAALVQYVVRNQLS